MTTEWQHAARQLAGEATDPGSRWRPVVAAVPRHVFVPRWWKWEEPDRWVVQDGPSVPPGWMRAAYRDRTLIIRVGTVHADCAQPEDHPAGQPTSSATKPGLVVAMYRFAALSQGVDVLDVGTGSGYGCALLARRLGDDQVTSVDIDEYLARSAAGRLSDIGLHPQVIRCDATGPLPGTYDRIVSMMSVAPVPSGWLTALRPGGRLMTTLAGSGLIVTADKTPDGGARGRTEWHRAAFMAARAGADYPPPLLGELPGAIDGDGDETGIGRYPVVDTASAWELFSMLGVSLPGLQHHFEQQPEGRRTAWLLHPDGSWARATEEPGEAVQVHQSGPRRLWDICDGIRESWLRNGNLPAYGAAVTIDPDGAVHLRKGRWRADILPSVSEPQL